ncbi:MAG: AI-2E family transporter [Acidobacteria bacterium]|nr:AI-2E family transporter [Acidobacteriota bacterium]
MNSTDTEPASATPEDSSTGSIDTESGRGLRRSLLGKNPALRILAICAVILLLQYMRDVLIPFVLAAVLFYALDPLVDRLQHWRVPRVLGAAFAIFALVGAVGGLAYGISDNVIEVINEVPAATQKLRATMRANRNRPPGAMEKLQQAATELDKTAAEVAGPSETPAGVVRVQVEEPAVGLSEYIRWGPAGVMSIAGGVVMVLFLAYFLLVTDDLFKRRLVEVMGPTLTHQKLTVQVLNEIATQIEAFLMVQIFTSVLVGVLTWLALWWIGLSNAVVWGLAAGILNSIPYFGPLIVTGGLALIAYMQFGTVPMALTVAGIALLITALEGWILTPLLMSRVAQINAVAIFAGLLFWSWLWGLWGTLLAVPIMMALKAACDRVEDLRPIGKLLED